MTARKKNDPAVRQGFRSLVDGARNDKERDAIAAAEQDIIAYYYDMLCALTLRRMGAKQGTALPDAKPMRDAVTELNRACANQKKPYLFGGAVNNPADLFAFASGIVLPATA